MDVKSASNPGQLKTVTSDELRELMKNESELGYALIDVRESEEYAFEHLPGAKNIPFMELEAHASELRAMSETLKIFYCHSGVRASRAARLAAAELKVEGVAILVGGVASWSGDRVVGMPRLKAFPSTGTVREVLVRALDLEKGAEALYARLLDKLGHTAAGPILSKLVQAEKAHEEALYAILVSESKEPVEPLDQLLASLTGNVLENGEGLEDALARTQVLGCHGPAGVLEVALDLELTAYDLYRNLANRAADEGTRRVLLQIAHDEREHAANVLRGMNELYAEAANY